MKRHDPTINIDAIASHQPPDIADAIDSFARHYLYNADELEKERRNPNPYHALARTILHLAYLADDPATTDEDLRDAIDLIAQAADRIPATHTNQTKLIRPAHALARHLRRDFDICGRQSLKEAIETQPDASDIIAAIIAANPALTPTPDTPTTRTILAAWHAYLDKPTTSNRNEVVRQHWPLCERIAREHARPDDPVSVNDLEAYAGQGLIRAIESYDPTRPDQELFEVYAGGFIADEIQQQRAQTAPHRVAIARAKRAAVRRFKAAACQPCL